MLGVRLSATPGSCQHNNHSWREQTLRGGVGHLLAAAMTMWSVMRGRLRRRMPSRETMPQEHPLAFRDRSIHFIVAACTMRHLYT
jgi:hypothetical protein